MRPGYTLVLVLRHFSASESSIKVALASQGEYILDDHTLTKIFSGGKLLTVS